MTAVFHPCVNDDGKAVLLSSPSSATEPATWLSADSIATAIPMGPLPRTLNGIDFSPWTPPQSGDWSDVPGQGTFEEPPFVPKAGKAHAAGVAILEDDGRVWLVSPSNRFGGYTNTLPKGRVDPGLSLRATAIREAYEESGLKVDLTGVLLDSERTQTCTRYYLGRRVAGTPALMGWETQAVHLVPGQALDSMLTHPNDKPLVAALLTLLAGTAA